MTLSSSDARYSKYPWWTVQRRRGGGIEEKDVGASYHFIDRSVNTSASENRRDAISDAASVMSEIILLPVRRKQIDFI